MKMALKGDPCAVHDADAAVTMRAALAPSFMALRRILVQLCGLMLLMDGRRAESREGRAVTLAALQPELAEVVDALHGAETMLGRRTARMQPMLAAGAEIETARATLARACAVSAAGQHSAGDVLALLQRAQRRLLAVSDDRAGLAMVGFTHACCCTPIPQAAALGCH
ncbi:MAG: hypothetical protein HIU92_20950 [Proteobacteria bacterium]|nr:hypothetical protein [Pseudomonadota bacterium]